ncbi:sensor histidine kinase [Desulfurivibrio sp. C05AmB]|uniref:sensor histidine kinase n=1 Tax=Desulfurivibrio sp. C05AmB TaxID=3374371 RepID=UPI00376F27C8
MQAQAFLEERAKLIERNKELSCLYEIAKIVAHSETSFAEVLQAIVAMLPSAFHHPDRVCARIVVDGQVFQSEGFADSPHMLRADLRMQERSRGVIEVFFRWREGAAIGDPFFPEERKLLQAIAGQVSLMIGNRLANEHRAQLESQLRHADRLAKVGQLTAGVAHELNEPLAAILGFAQLAAKKIESPEQASRYLDRIIHSCLHAREIIRKMMLFSSPGVPRTRRVDLNHLLTEGLSFIEPRFTRTSIRFVTELSPDLPPVEADSAQITQVLVNLVINAIHAMADGGTLTLRTEGGGGEVRMIVADTGIGMDAATLEQIFLPFFTTKDVDHGTGLGLSVVHGIVTGHGGSIDVQSSPGRGTTCTITFPVCTNDVS